MQRIYRNSFFIVVLLFIGISVKAENISDTTQPVSADPKLLEIFNAKLPIEYTIANIQGLEHL